MARYVALLRGINVGGHGKLPMADLRALLSGLGHGQVATYVQSGNAVFTSPSGDAEALARELEAELAARHRLTPMVLVLAAAELHRVVAVNPYPEVSEAKQLHVVFRQEQLSAAEVEGVVAAAERASAKGSPDSAAIVAGVLYLHTPDGLGRSLLAAQLARAGGVAGAGSTSRNWATVTRLATMVDALDDA